MPEPDSLQEVRLRYAECVRIVNNTMTTFLIFCLYSVISTISASDIDLIITGGYISLPVLDVEIPLKVYMVIAPVIIIFLLIYLHIFNSIRISSEQEHNIAKVATIFTNQDKLSRALYLVIFFILGPATLMIMFIKASVRVEWALPVGIAFYCPQLF